MLSNAVRDVIETLFHSFPETLFFCHETMSIFAMKNENFKAIDKYVFNAY